MGFSLNGVTLELSTILFQVILIVKVFFGLAGKPPTSVITEQAEVERPGKERCGDGILLWCHLCSTEISL